MPEVINYLLMKERFEQIYKKIEKLSNKDEYLVGRANSDKKSLGN